MKKDEFRFEMSGFAVCVTPYVVFISKGSECVCFTREHFDKVFAAIPRKEVLPNETLAEKAG